MKRITDHSGFFEDDGGCILRLLQEWKPQSFAVSEKDQEQDLLAWLKKKLPDVPMVAQYGIAKGKADIVVQDTHLIELKLGLVDIAEFQRCLGQMEIYRQKWVIKNRGPVYLVVVGESDVEFRDILHAWFERNGDKLHLIEKQPAS
jgi:hypothetical protein